MVIIMPIGNIGCTQNIERECKNTLKYNRYICVGLTPKPIGIFSLSVREHVVFFINLHVFGSRLFTDVEVM